MKLYYENDKKSKGIDSKICMEELSRMLKVNNSLLILLQESDFKLTSTSKQLEQYKKAVDSFQKQNGELQQERTRVMGQLQSLFVLYNKQKKTIDQLSSSKKDTELDKKTYQERLEMLEKENSKLKCELSKELEIRANRHKVLSLHNSLGRTRATRTKARRSRKEIVTKRR